MFRENTRDAHNNFEITRNAQNFKFMTRNAQNSEGIPEMPAPSFLRAAGHLSRKDNYRGSLKPLFKRFRCGSANLLLLNVAFCFYFLRFRRFHFLRSSVSFLSSSGGTEMTPVSITIFSRDRTLVGASPHCHDWRIRVAPARVPLLTPCSRPISNPFNGRGDNHFQNAPRCEGIFGCKEHRGEKALQGQEK